MTNIPKLKGRIVEKGFTLTSFAEAMKMSRPTLRSRLNGNTEFRVNEIDLVKTILDISSAEIDLYFFN